MLLVSGIVAAVADRKFGKRPEELPQLEAQRRKPVVGAPQLLRRQPRGLGAAPAPSEGNVF